MMISYMGHKLEQWEPNVATLSRTREHFYQIHFSSFACGVSLGQKQLVFTGLLIVVGRQKRK